MIEEPRVQNDKLFESWCEELAKTILEEKIIVVAEVKTAIMFYIKRTEAVFFQCLMDKLDYDISELKEKMVSFQMMGNELSILNEKRKLLNIAKSKKLPSDYKAFRVFLSNRNCENLIKEFEKSRTLKL